MPDIELDDSGDAVLSIDPVKLLYSWSQLPKSKSATEAIQLLLTSITLKHTKPKTETPATRKRTSETEESQSKRAREEWKCQSCDLTFKTHLALRRHMNNKCIHPSKQQAAKSHKGKSTQKQPEIVYSNGGKRWRCGVCKKTLSNKSNLYRHMQTVHAKDQMQSEKVDKVKVDEVVDKDNIRSEKVIGSIVYVCRECTAAAAKIDSAFEHAQLHHLNGYKPIMQTCNVCKFAIEVEHYADHISNHSDDYIKLKYNPFELLKADWHDMFSELSEAHVNKIKSSSVYQHTRKVKMNTDNDSGIPLYQCDLCAMYVSPNDVEDHCNDGKVCATDEASGYFCSDCEIFFYTSEALKAHEKEHNEGLRVDSFRTVYFNSKEDAPINKALRKRLSESESDKDPGGHAVVQQNGSNNGTPHRINEGQEDLDDIKPNGSSEEGPHIINEAQKIQAALQPSGSEKETQHRKNKGIEILDDRRVNIDQFCCGKYIPYLEIKAHIATHKDKADKENQRIEKVAQKANSEITDVNEDPKIPGDNTYQRSLEVTESQSESVVQENPAPQKVTFNEKTKETVQKGTINEFNTDPKSNSTPSKSQRKIIGVNNNFSEEMENELRLDLKQLFKKSDLYMNSSIPVLKSSLDTPREENDALYKEREEIKSNEDKLKTTVESTKPDESHIKPDPSPINYEPTEIIEINDSDDEPEDKMTKVKKVSDNDEIRVSPRMSSRDILSKMLPSTSSELDLTDVIVKEKRNGRKRKFEQQMFIDETQRIRDIMSSRDYP